LKEKKRKEEKNEEKMLYREGVKTKIKDKKKGVGRGNRTHTDHLRLSQYTDHL
jgi:hypothetical protein